MSCVSWIGFCVVMRCVASCALPITVALCTLIVCCFIAVVQPRADRVLRTESVAVTSASASVIASAPGLVITFRSFNRFQIVLRFLSEPDSPTFFPEGHTISTWLVQTGGEWSGRGVVHLIHSFVSPPHLHFPFVFIDISFDGLVFRCRKRLIAPTSFSP